MQKILLLGAGRSSGALINYILKHAEQDGYHLTVADISLEQALEKTGNHPFSEALALDINNADLRQQIISEAALIISLLPPSLHIIAAGDCIRLKKTMVTASYVTPALNALHTAAVNAGVLLLNECGLDPGIDHMSAMEIFHRLKLSGAELIAFKSYTGGLVAPEYVDNLWGYKFTWNPRNVILAGQGTAKYIENGKYHYIPYNRLFKQTELIEIENARYEGYANRDSLTYRKHYDIETIPTLLRGTLRQEGYCRAWDAFVQLGLTDDECRIEHSEQLTYRDVIESFLPAKNNASSLEKRVADFLNIDGDSKIMLMLQSTGIFDDIPTGLKDATAAMILQNLLERKWVLQKNDRDMIVMVHQIKYILNGKQLLLTSSLTVKGDDQVTTAMAKTVGYPLGIVARLILKNKIKLTGVQLPVHPDIYNPVLKELSEMGITFKERTDTVSVIHS
jgi:saccharopine dehydrogenase-like NADP-dependent oxidoreductase